jgi:hypothetical protein
MVGRVKNVEWGTPPTDGTVTAVRAALVESVNAMISSFEEGDEWEARMPPALVTQIQYMARHGMSLEEILRGFTLIGNVFFEFFVDKLGQLPQDENTLRYMAHWQSLHYEKVVNSFTSVYTAEIERMDNSPSRELREQVKRLLAGELADVAKLGYRLDSFHIGAIATGPDAELASQTLAERMGCELLLVPSGEDTVWAWFGARRRIEFAKLEQSLGVKGPAGDLTVTVGEPREGVDGWRLTHREAEAALIVALIERPRLTRYSDVALLAEALRGEASGPSLIDRYLQPLDRHRDGGGLRETLRVYLDRDCNAASASAALGVDRHTVQRRLKRVEVAVGEPIPARRAELDLALRLEQLTAAIATRHGPAT